MCSGSGMPWRCAIVLACGVLHNVAHLLRCVEQLWLLQCDISNFTHASIDTNTEHKETIKGLLDSSVALFSPGKTKNTYLNGCAQMGIVLVYIQGAIKR